MSSLVNAERQVAIPRVKSTRDGDYCLRLIPMSLELPGTSRMYICSQPETADLNIIGCGLEMFQLAEPS
jgi:hypothetical protein